MKEILKVMMEKENYPKIAARTKERAKSKTTIFLALGLVLGFMAKY